MNELYEALSDPTAYVLKTAKTVLGKRKGRGKFVRHHQTCPACGRHLVNTYVNEDGEWKCRKCWEEAEADA